MIVKEKKDTIDAVILKFCFKEIAVMMWDLLEIYAP